MTKEIIIHGIYKDYKGNQYEVLNLATHAETGEEMVVYRLYRVILQCGRAP